MPFFCSICEAESARICASCTKDTCEIHLCEKCLRCSDCCDCEIPLNTQAPMHSSPEPEPIVPDDSQEPPA